MLSTTRVIGRSKVLLGGLFLLGTAFLFEPSASGTSITFSALQTTYTNIGGTGVNLTITCLDSAGACSVDQATGTTAFGLGVSGPSDGTTAIDNNQSLVFSFSAPVSLTDVIFTLATAPNNNKYALNNCSSATCVGATSISTGAISGTANSTVTLTFNTAAATIFQVAGTNPNSAFGISGLDFGGTSAVPEPAALPVVGLSLIGLYLAYRRKPSVA